MKGNILVSIRSRVLHMVQVSDKVTTGFKFKHELKFFPPRFISLFVFVIIRLKYWFKHYLLGKYVEFLSLLFTTKCRQFLFFLPPFATIKSSFYTFKLPKSIISVERKLFKMTTCGPFEVSSALLYYVLRMTTLKSMT